MFFRSKIGSWTLPKRHTPGQRLSLFYVTETMTQAMSRNHLTAKVREDAVIAFLLFCLEIYQAEQQRKRKLH